MKEQWEKAQECELDTWLCKDEKTRKKKCEREMARYPKIIKELGLDLIDLSDKTILEIGCGPVGVISKIKCFRKFGLDPLADEYGKYFPTEGYEIIKGVGEKIPLEDNGISLILIVNALDHMETPIDVIKECKRVLEPSGWLAVHNCIDLAKHHKHPAHKININYEQFREWVDSDFETVSELTWDKDKLRYGWIKYQGKIGQPSFAWLGRITTKGV